MRHSFVHRSIAIVGIFLVPSISSAQCWIAGVRNTNSAVAVTFMNLRVQGLQGIAERKGTNPTSEVLFRFTVAEGKVLRDGKLLPELFVPKKPVSGAKRIGPVSFQDLKFCSRSSVIMVFASLYGAIHRGECNPPLHLVAFIIPHNSKLKSSKLLA